MVGSVHPYQLPRLPKKASGCASSMGNLPPPNKPPCPFSGAGGASASSCVQHGCDTSGRLLEPLRRKGGIGAEEGTSMGSSFRVGFNVAPELRIPLHTGVIERQVKT